MINILRVFFVTTFTSLLMLGASSQVVVSTNSGATADPAAILDIQSTTMGFVAPRMTAAQIAAISLPPKGLIAFQTDGNVGYYYNTGTDIAPVWNRITDDTTPGGYWSLNGADVYYTAGNVGIGTASPAVPLDVVGDARISGELTFTDGASDGYVLTSNATGVATWQAAAGDDGDWLIAGNNMSSVPTGNVGIGTTGPIAKLDVDGSARITGALAFTNSPTDGYVLKTDGSGNATWEDVDNLVTNDADWLITGNNMSNLNSGFVGIGSATPVAKLDVVGASHFTNDSVYITGRPGKIFLDAEATYTPTVRYGYDGTALYRTYISDPATNPYFTLTAAPYEDIWGLQQTGRVWHNPKSTTDNVSGHVISTSSPARALSITQSNGTDLARGIQVTMSNTGNSTAVIGIGGWAYGDASALYGENDATGNYGHVGTSNNAVYGQHGTTANRGSIGTSAYGVYGRTGELVDYHWGAIGVDGTTDYGVYGAEGQLTTDPNFGGIGTSNYGVYGEYNAENFYGALGEATSAVYGRLGGTSQNLSDGDYAVKGIGVEASDQDASDYAYNDNVGGVMGYNVAGSAYSFGVAGFTADGNDQRSAAVLGANYSGDLWGAIAYRSSAGGRVAGYFTTAITTGGGDQASGTPIVNIGIASYGDLMGAHINGNIYGLYATGENYGIYSDGDMYRTGADVHIQENANGENSVMYTLVSTEMTVQTYGIGSMQGGKSSIVFDQAFADVVSTDEPIVVTITPIGQTKGVYLDRVNANGFAVAENNNGKSNVQFSWIAIGKRKGYENVNLPADVIASDYNTKIQRGLSNDADLNQQAEGLYYQNGMLHTGQTAVSRSNTGIAIAPAKDLEPIVVDDATDASLSSPAIEKAEEAGTDKK